VDPEAGARDAGAPRTRLLQLAHEGPPFAAVGLLSIAEGELWVRPPWGGRLRLAVGDLLVVRLPGHALELTPRANAVALSLQADPLWVERTLAHLGCGGSFGHSAFGIAWAHSKSALRASQLLHSLQREEDPLDGAADLRRATSWLELLSIAHVVPALCEPGEARRPAGRHRRALLEALSKLENENLESLTLCEFSDRLVLSERQVSRLMRLEIGLSFREYLNELRVKRAQRLLAAGEAPVIEVAAEAGFGSLSHFNAVFRARTGATPTLFRERSRSAPQIGPRLAGEALSTA
jgi:AraC-like DNA-binding protein